MENGVSIPPASIKSLLYGVWSYSGHLLAPAGAQIADRPNSTRH